MLTHHLSAHGKPDHVCGLAIIDERRDLDGVIEISGQTDAPLNRRLAPRAFATVNAYEFHGVAVFRAGRGTARVPIDFLMGAVRLIGVLSDDVLNDEPANEPALRLICTTDDSGFRAWLAIEQGPGVWAMKEFEKIADGDWRLRPDEPKWLDAATREEIASRGYARLDGEVKRLPELLRLRREIAGSFDELVAAWDRAAFGPKSRRGYRTQPGSAPRNRAWRQRKRQGLPTRAPQTFANILIQAETEDEAKLLAALMPQSQRQAAIKFRSRPQYDD